MLQPCGHPRVEGRDPSSQTPSPRAQLCRRGGQCPSPHCGTLSGPNLAPRLAEPGSMGRTAKVTAHVIGSWRLSPPGSSGQAELDPQLRVHVTERNSREDRPGPSLWPESLKQRRGAYMLLGLALARQGEDTGLGPQQTLAQGEFLFLTCPSPRAFMQADWMCNTGGIFLHEASKCLPPCPPAPRTGAFPLTGTFTSGTNTLSPHFSTPTLSPDPAPERES